MVRKALAVFCAGLGLAQSGSVSSCGGPSDHFSNVSIVLSPDPISRSTPFTLTLTGVLDEDHVGGTVDVDLQVKALHVIDKAVKGQTSYTISPGLAKGPQKLVIGPVTLPKDPGDAVLKGQISIKDTQGEAVACVALDIEVPFMAAEEAQQALGPVTPCGAPTDHLKDIAISKSGEVTTITASLDEDLASVVAKVDLKIEALFLKVPLKLQVPVSFSPAVRKGDWKLTVETPSLNQAVNALGGIKVEGQVALDDAKSQEVTCLAIDSADRQQLVV